MNIALMLFIRGFVMDYWWDPRYDSEKFFSSSNASLSYSLVSCLTIFSDLPTSSNIVLTNLLGGFDPNFGQIVHILYINQPEVLFCKHGDALNF